MRFCVLGVGCFWSRVSLEMSSGDGSNERLFMDDGRHFSEREAARGFWVLSFCVLLGLFRQHGGAWPIVYPEFLPCVCFMKIFFFACGCKQLWVCVSHARDAVPQRIKMESEMFIQRKKIKELIKWK